MRDIFNFLMLVSTLVIVVDSYHVPAFGSFPFNRNCQRGWMNQKMTTTEPTVDETTSRVYVVNGTETKVNEYPAMAALITTNSQPVEVYCGATIISNVYLLTAAHCTYNRNMQDLLVLVGEHNIKLGNETNSTALYNIIAYIMHPGYNPNNQENDIAILQVNRMNFNRNVGPICLPFRHISNTFEQEEVIVLGWGHTEFNGPSSNTLQKVDVDVISNVECATQLATPVHSNAMCTYAESRGSCQSDSGGPLLWRNKDTKGLLLVGITSYGIACAGGFPDINVRVTPYLEWIQSTTNGNFCSI